MKNQEIKKKEEKNNITKIGLEKIYNIAVRNWYGYLYKMLTPFISSSHIIHKLMRCFIKILFNCWTHDDFNSITKLNVITLYMKMCVQSKNENMIWLNLKWNTNLFFLYFYYFFYIQVCIYILYICYIFLCCKYKHTYNLMFRA